VAAVLVAFLVAAPVSTAQEPDESLAAGTGSASMPIVPQPVQQTVGDGPPFELGEASVIVVPRPASPAVYAVAEYLVDVLRPSTGFDLPIVSAPAGRGSFIELSDRGPEKLGQEGYRLHSAGPHRLSIQGSEAAGLFRGVQTLRQLLPARVEAASVQPGPWLVDPVDIVDYPRFEYRGVMLDVARRFVSADDVKRFIDQAARYKMNVFHWHLTDDQGWRIPIDGMPELTEIGGSTQSGWAPGTGGPWYYTAEEYREIIDYAAERYITVVPEIDGPGHVRAALASVPGLNCDNESPPPYYGFDVRVSAFCLETEEHVANVEEFVETVFAETAAMSPGPFLHVGGDEVEWLSDEQYNGYVEHAGKTLEALGKRMIGWHDIGVGPLSEGSVLQYWGTASDRSSIGTPNESRNVQEVRAGLAQGAQVLVSPADRSYLDMKYHASTPYGLQWAGLTTVEKAYDWDPMTALARPDGSQSVLREDDVIGVEAPLWADRAYAGSHQLPTSLDQFPEPSVYMDFMAFPRLPAIAEIGWSPREAREWDDFRYRLAAQGDRWDHQGIDFYRSAEIDWDMSERAVVADIPGQIAYDAAGQARLPVTVTNRSASVAEDVSVHLDITDADGSSESVAADVGRLAVGEQRALTFDIETPADSAADLDVEMTITWIERTERRQVTTDHVLRVSCATEPTTPVAVVDVSSEETVGEDGAAANAIDGDPATIWHTEWSQATPSHPHQISVDLGAPMEVCAFRYLPRQTGTLNGSVADFEVYLSTDGENWGDPVAAGTFAADRDEKWVPLTRAGARYVRFVALSEVNSGPWTSAAEVAVDAVAQ
jgi:hexosaminidase